MLPALVIRLIEYKTSFQKFQLETQKLYDALQCLYL